MLDKAGRPGQSSRKSGGIMEKPKTPRGPCPVCNQGFDPATDAEWAHRWNYHLLFSERHKKYERLKAAGVAGTATTQQAAEGFEPEHPALAVHPRRGTMAAQ